MIYVQASYLITWLVKLHIPKLILVLGMEQLNLAQRDEET